MSFFRWGPKPSVGAQRKTAEQRLAKSQKGGRSLSPVVIDGRKIATSFWGKAWCDNLESYSDYANRLPRGRSYVRHRCVIDLQIASGEITAQVSGSSLYMIKITVAPLQDKSWRGICQDCAGSINSVVELLQGRLSEAVMERVCRAGNGLFPAPKAITLSCSCPDGAAMCKHVAATLYGVGARLDSMPELLFKLRGVDQQQLIAHASATPVATTGKATAKSRKVLAGADLSALFGLDMDAPTPAAAKAETSAGRAARKPVSGRRLGKSGPTRETRRTAPPPAKRAANTGKTRRPSRSAKSGKLLKPATTPKKLQVGFN